MAVLIVSYDEIVNIVQGADNYPILKEVRWFAGESIAKESFVLRDAIASEFVDAVGLTAFQIFENRGDKFARVTQHNCGPVRRGPGHVRLPVVRRGMAHRTLHTGERDVRPHGREGGPAGSRRDI